MSQDDFSKNGGGPVTNEYGDLIFPWADSGDHSGSYSCQVYYRDLTNIDEREREREIERKREGDIYIYSDEKRERESEREGGRKYFLSQKCSPGQE